MDNGRQYLRKASLLLVEGDKALDLSELHFRFATVQQDEESPDNCSIRVYNLSEDTAKKVRTEFSKVVVQAGYETAGFGIVFSGTIKQFRIGREPDGLSTYLDILAADGDLAYNFSMCSKTLAAGSRPQDRIAVAQEAMKAYGVLSGNANNLAYTGGTLPRGKVLFGLSRNILRQEAATCNASWAINNGQLVFIKRDGYLPNEAVVLTSMTGLVGRVEQTIDGMRARCLLNPNIVVGGLVRIDNASINKTVQQDPEAAPVPYNQWAGLQLLADVAADGLYRVYVAEHVGDTRGQDWYTDIVCLAVNPASGKVVAP